MIALVCMLASFVPASVAADESEEVWETGKRYNIMLVIDGSGSLISHTKTDPDGMRYELLDDLLGILEDEGHYVGAIVFSGNRTYSDSDEAMVSGIRLNTGMLSLSEKAPDGSLPKDYIAKKVRQSYVDMDPSCKTDVGTALLVAEQELQKMNNGLESLVFLFTDGVTDVAYEHVMAKSQENLATATREMSQNGIRLFGAFLNKNGKIDSSEIADMVCAANGVGRNSLEFANSYVEITDAASCHQAVTVLLRFLGYITGSVDAVPHVDTIEDTFTIPGVGVEEFNIRLYSYMGDNLPAMDVQLTMPDGTVLSGVSLDSLCRSSRTIRVYKLQDPMPGQWHLKVTVPEKNTIAYVYDKVYSLLVGSGLTITPDVTDLHVNLNAAFTATLSQRGQTVTDPLAYQGYTCRLEVKNLETNEVETFPIEGKDGIFVKDMLLGQYGRFSARIVFSCDGFEVPSSYIPFDLVNHEPEIRTPIPVDVKYGPMQEKSAEVDLSRYFSDLEDGTNLNMTLVDPGQCSADGYSLDGYTLNITNSKIGEGTLTFRITDSQGAGGELKVQITSKNTLPAFIAMIVAILVIAAVIVIVVIRKREGQNLRGDLSVTLGLEVEHEKSIDLDLQIPGREAANKTNLKTLLNHALVNEADRVKPGITCAMVKNALAPYWSELEKITLTKVMTKDAGKPSAGIQIKQGSKKYVMPGKRMVDLFVDDMSICLVYSRPMDEDDDVFGTDMDFAAPSRGKKEKKGAAKRENVSDFDDLF